MNYYERTLEKIACDSNKCKPMCCCIEITGATGPTGLTGLIGPTGSAGNNVDSTSCLCVDQMRNIIQQIITLYPMTI